MIEQCKVKACCPYRENVVAKAEDAARQRQTRHSVRNIEEPRESRHLGESQACPVQQTTR